MKKLLTLALLLCTTLLSAQKSTATPWQEIDTLIAKGHYTSAYEKSEQLLKKAKRKGDSHAMLKAVYKQRTAAAFYQEEHIDASIKAYEEIIPKLRGADKSIAYMLLGTFRNDAKKRTCYEKALTEAKALKAVKAEEYDLLNEGDTSGLRLRPTLYDVVMHRVTEDMYLGSNKTRQALSDQTDQLFGTAEEFITLSFPDDSLSYELWQLSMLQTLTRHHLNTTDAAVRAHVDRKRMEKLKSLARNSTLDTPYINGMERIAGSYADSPGQQAMFLYMLAEYHQPNIYEHSGQETAAKELKKAEKMEKYIERIRRIAPDSEYAKQGEALYKRATNPYLNLQNSITILPERESSMTLTVRNIGDILYRIIPRHAGESADNFDYMEIIGRKPVGKDYMKISHEYSNPYDYRKITLTLPPLDAGEYFLFAANAYKDKEDSRASVTAFSVSNLKLSMIVNEAEEEYIGMVIDATTGRAVTDCDIMLMEKSNKKTHFIEGFTPDEKGYFTIPLPTGKYRNLYVQATDGESQATYQLQYYDFPEHRYRNRDDEASTLFTFLPDRYSYEPGDTVRFGLIAYSHHEEGSRVKSRLPIGISLKDTRNKEVASLHGTTDEWGRFNGMFAIPEGTPAGRFRLQATDSISDRTMYHHINVEAYKAPTFKATIERPEGTVRFGDSLTLQGTATTFTELPVGGAKVKYEVAITDMNIFGRYPLPDYYISETSGVTTTDEKGHFYIPIKTVSFNKPEENATQNYIITAHITDAGGETQTARTSFVVGYRTKHIDFTVPATFRHGDSIHYSLRTLNGERIAENVTLRLSKLKVPHSTGILSTVESGKSQWSEEHTYIHRTEQTASDGDSYMVLTKNLPYGFYRLTVTYTDGGKQYSEDYHLDLWGEGKGSVSSNILYQTKVATRDDIMPGDTAVLHVGTRHNDVYIHYYIQIENRVVDKGTLCLSDEMIALRVPVKEEWRNSMRIALVSVKENVRKICSESFSIKNKADILNVHLSTMRNYLEPGEKEQCTVSISDYYGNPVQSAFALSIYDAALDTYGANRWDIALAPTKYGRSITMEESAPSAWNSNTYVSVPRSTQPKYYTLPEDDRYGKQVFYSLSAPETTRGQAKSRAGFDMANAEYLVVEEAETEDTAKGAGIQNAEATETPAPYLRTDLSHTVLFLPDLHTDEQGQVTFTFTAPDLLTQWHVKGIAHTKELKHGRVNASFITRKELMVQPHLPRFLYEGDECNFTARVSNSSNETLEAAVKLETHLNPPCEGGLETPRCQYPLPHREGWGGSTTITIEPGSSTTVTFPITVPTGATSLTYRITAQGGHHSDGEQGTITILPRRTLVTETMALYANGKEKREFVFDALKEKHSGTLEHKSLTLDIVTNPIWYAIEALPPLCKEENPSSERLFHRYYAATMASYLIDRYPEVEGYNDFYRRDSLTALCTDLLNRLADSQGTDGGWAWMNGFDSDRYTTLLIIKGLGELEAMGCIGIARHGKFYTMVKNGIGFLDRQYDDSYRRMKQKPKTLGSYELYYLYTRSMFPEITFDTATGTAYSHYKQLLLKDKATRGSLMQKALKMLTLIRLTERNKANAIAEVVSQSSLSNDEMGIYWRDNSYGWSWDSNPIATQALLIEAFTLLDQPADITGRMQQWLLKQKQTTRWNNSIATAQAVHALVASPLPLPRRGDTDLSKSVEVKVKNATLNLIDEDKRGTIRYEVIPERDKRTSAMQEIPLQLQGSEEASLSWGSLTWQYYEDADKVNASGTGLSLKCTYYKVENENGKEILSALPEGPLSLGEGGGRGLKGDRIRVRLHFTTDRAMDYVELHLKRPAALEPVTTRSGYSYSNGLGYYQSIENTGTKFYFYRLNKGKYFIDCDLWVSQSGSYTCGVSTIQCMYAPEFVATAPSMTLDFGE